MVTFLDGSPFCRGLGPIEPSLCLQNGGPQPPQVIFLGDEISGALIPQLLAFLSSWDVLDSWSIFDGIQWTPSCCPMCHFVLFFMFHVGCSYRMSQLMMGVICKHGPPRQRTCLFEVWAQGAVQSWLCGDEYQQHLGKKCGFCPWGPWGGSLGDVL